MLKDEQDFMRKIVMNANWSLEEFLSEDCQHCEFCSNCSYKTECNNALGYLSDFTFGSAYKYYEYAVEILLNIPFVREFPD